MMSDGWKMPENPTVDDVVAYLRRTRKIQHILNAVLLMVLLAMLGSVALYALL